jgi:electron transfer flavoprotein alpha subunit
MPRVAARTKAPLVTNCLEIKVDDEVQFVKTVQNGRLHATVVCKRTGTKMATISPEALMVAEEINLPSVAQVTEITPEKDEVTSIHVRGFLKADHKTIDITEAEFVVAIGKGIGSEDRFPIYQEFADRIGAAIGVTRRVVDDGILPFDRQIGQTGKEVSPRLIVMCGISGAMEFTKGIERARTKIAINKDRKAPILKAVDLGIVEDLNILIPQLIKHIDDRGNRDERE